MESINTHEWHDKLTSGDPEILHDVSDAVRELRARLVGMGYAAATDDRAEALAAVVYWYLVQSVRG
jgi:hypothetical protein